jgi:two-component system phosphate regulon sensor histidine kinase PhoR
MKEIKKSTVFWYATLIVIPIILLETYLIRMIYLKEADKFNNNVKLALIECDRKLEKYYSSYFILNTKDSTTFSHKANKDFNFDFQYIGSTNVAKSFENKGLDRSTNFNLKKIVSTLNNIVVIDKEVNRNVQTNNENVSFLLLKMNNLSGDKLINTIEKNKTISDSLIRECFTNRGIQSHFDIDFIKFRDGDYNSRKLFTSNFKLQYSISLFTKSNEVNPTISKNTSSDLLYITFHEKLKYFIYLKLRIYLFIVLLVNVFIIFLAILLLNTIIKQQKLSELKNAFINNMSHELKTPLATIQFAIANIENISSLENSNLIRQLTKIINQESLKMNHHIEQILQTNSAEGKQLVLNKETFDFHQLINDLIANFNLANKIVFITNFNASKALIHANKVDINGVFSNLFDNAIKYNTQSPFITIESENCNGGILVKIIDNGIGIASEDINRIFDKFFRVTTGNIHNTKGFGLGLSYVKAIVIAHKGTITVSSKLDIGTIFTVFLPH